MEPAEAPGRPWAATIGLVMLGVVVAGIANVSGQYGEPGSAQRFLGFLGYAGGLFVAGIGVHRFLWFRPTARSRPARVFLTVLATLPTFVLAALFLSVFLTVFQRRFTF